MNESSTNKIVSPSEKEKIPTGISIILFSIGSSLITKLFWLAIAIVQSGAITVIASLDSAYSLLEGVILGLCFYGILKRKKWARKLTIGWYLITISGLIFSLMNKEKFINLVNQNLPQEISLSLPESFITTVVYGIALNVVINCIIIFYIYRKKEFFKN